MGKLHDMRSTAIGMAWKTAGTISITGRQMTIQGRQKTYGWGKITLKVKKVLTSVTRRQYTAREVSQKLRRATVNLADRLFKK